MSWYNRRNSSRSYGGFAPYVPVAQRRANAAKAAQKAAKGGARFTPVAIEGRAIAHTFWGKAWCAHQESFSDYANRLPRGRTYVRNGSVIHLALSAGRIEAKVMGSSLYTVEIVVAPLLPQKWAAIKTACAGKIDSLVSLLQGRLSDAVMRIVSDQANGLFPSPAETKLRCSCPDSANLCKHLSAVLYGVGARLDTQPELLFLLRGVDHLELIGGAVAATALPETGASAIADDQLADVFGIEIDAGTGTPATPATDPALPPAAKSAAKRSGPADAPTKPVAKKKPAAKGKPAKSARPTKAPIKTPARPPARKKPKQSPRVSAQPKRPPAKRATG